MPSSANGQPRGAMVHKTAMRGVDLTGSRWDGASFHQVDATGAVGADTASFDGARIRESRMPIGLRGANEITPERVVSRQRVAKWKDPKLVAESRGEVTELDL